MFQTLWFLFTPQAEVFSSYKWALVMIWNPRIEHSADLHHLASLSSVEFALSFFPPPKPSRPRPSSERRTRKVKVEKMFPLQKRSGEKQEAIAAIAMVTWSPSPSHPHLSTKPAAALRPHLWRPNLPFLLYLAKYLLKVSQWSLTIKQADRTCV